MLELTDLEHMLSLSRRMVETHALQPLLEYAMNEALQLVGAERGYIVLLNEDGSLDFRVRQGADAGELGHTEDQVSTSILQSVLQTGQPQVIKSAMDDPKWKGAKSVGVLKLRSVMCVPLISDGVSIGAIYVENRSIGNRFTEAGLATLALFAQQASVSIENARLYNLLEQQVQERTQELRQEIERRKRSEDELRRSNEELQARNEELDAFAHTVAHDIKGPLNNIAGFSELLCDKSVPLSDAERDEYYTVLLRTAGKISRIIDELLLLAGVRKMQVVPQPVDMADVVSEVLRRMADQITTSHADIVLPTQWPVALGYAPWIEEIWVNYISNACKYGWRDDLSPRIELAAKVQDDAMIRFEVHDDGPGLSPEKQSQLFMPFTRLDQVRVEGNGLGLSIVHRIATRLGGQVGVESDGHGSTFFFTLPSA
jgi:signal transduction histidine kinase